MLEVIADKLHHSQCDEIMEVSWSTLWNITDETAVNCQRFLDGRGMDLFISCLEVRLAHQLTTEWIFLHTFRPV